jgi:hypothetical protein
MELWVVDCWGDIYDMATRGGEAQGEFRKAVEQEGAGFDE